MRLSLQGTLNVEKLKWSGRKFLSDSESLVSCFKVQHQSQRASSNTLRRQSGGNYGKMHIGVADFILRRETIISVRDPFIKEGRSA